MSLDMPAVRDQILAPTLSHVPFDGWTRAALRRGVADAGFGPDMGPRAFPGGMMDLLAHFSDFADRRMLDALDALDLDSMRVRDRVAAGVRLRLEALAPHREAVRRGLSFLALPMHAPLALRLTYNTVNAIWVAAGDRSADFNFYTKRGLLAPVYATTVLYWLNDTSDGFADTWDYLDRRLGDVLKIPALKTRLKDALDRCRPGRRRAQAG